MAYLRTGSAMMRLVLFFLFIVGFIVSPCIAAQQADSDRGALKQLDDDLDAGNQLNWGTAQDGDAWDGVAWQSPPDGRVTQIVASNKGLTGSSNAWGTLSALTYLNVFDNKLTELDVTQNTNLTLLLVSNNQLTQLDVTNNADLTYLNVSYNQLTQLDVTKNADLSSLDVSNNQLTQLDVKHNSDLTELSVGANLLTEIDVTKNTALKHLNVFNNQLTQLDVTKNANLTSLNVSYNQLTQLDVTKNADLTHVDVSNNLLTELDVTRNTALTSLYASGNRLKSVSSIAGNATVQTVDVHNNALPLSELYSLMGKTNLYLGQQNNVAYTAFAGGVLATGTTYDVGEAERAIGGKDTVFTIVRKDSTTATENVHYTIDNGVITFLVPGDYIVSMENENVYSKGQVEYYDEYGNTQIANFETDSNPYGMANPLAEVRTGQMSVLGDDLSTRLLVRVEQAGASINARRLAVGLDTAVFVDKVVLDGSELGQLYTAAKGAASDAESLFIVNQMHLESVAGGMDAIISSSARPFMNRLHGRAAIRPSTDSRTIAAANSWNAYAQLSGLSSGSSAYGFDAAATGLGQFASMSSHDGYLGYDLKNYGGFVSLDKVFGEGRFGLALGYSHTKVDWTTTAMRPSQTT